MICHLYNDYYNIINLLNIILYKLGFKERDREGESSLIPTLKNMPRYYNAHKLYT